MFALVDCNNFYVSCERAFNPRLENKPVVVLSNNDGCVISRSNEAKKLKIPMGAPFYQWQHFCKQHDVHVFSSNYELYGDMSQRVMSLLKEFNPVIEVYSIDEAFLYFNHPLSSADMIELKKRIKQATGIPTSIGVAETKTLAKMANHLAKNTNQRDVFFLKSTASDLLVRFPVEKIWGIGSRLASKLKKLNIPTAAALQAADAKMIRMHFSVTVEKIVQELNGVPCLALEQAAPRKQIISSRSFGKVVTELTDLEEAVSHYVTKAAKRLRQQRSVASALYVFLQTNRFKDHHPQYGNGAMFPFPAPTSDSRYLIRIAKKCVRSIFKKNYAYHKAGVMLLDISPQNIKQYDLLQAVTDVKSERLMQTIDAINAQIGKNTIFLAAEGTERTWLNSRKRLSARYTTRWQELPSVT